MSPPAGFSGCPVLACTSMQALFLTLVQFLIPRPALLFREYDGYTSSFPSRSRYSSNCYFVWQLRRPKLTMQQMKAGDMKHFNMSDGKNYQPSLPILFCWDILLRFLSLKDAERPTPFVIVSEMTDGQESDRLLRFQREWSISTLGKLAVMRLLLSMGLHICFHLLRLWWATRLCHRYWR